MTGIMTVHFMKFTNETLLNGKKNISKGKERPKTEQKEKKFKFKRNIK